MSKAKGDYAVVLDDDGQSPVDSLQAMMEMFEESNCDAVWATSRAIKHGGLFRRLGSWLNNVSNNIMFGHPKNRKIIPFYGLKKYVVDEITANRHPYAFVSGLVYRTTSNISYLETIHRARSEGRSGYTIKKLIKLWMDGFTAFSIKPLRIATFLGFSFSIIGFAFGFITAIRRLMNPDIAVGWSSMIVVMLIIGGLNFILFGMLGEYIGRIYMCINKSPQYIVKQCIDLRDENTERPDEVRA